MVAGMGDADLLHAAMHRTGDFGLLRFLPAATLAVASAAAGPERYAVPHHSQWVQFNRGACVLSVVARTAARAAMTAHDLPALERCVGRIFTPLVAGVAMCAAQGLGR